MTRLIGTRTAAAGVLCLAGAIGAFTYGCSDDEPGTTVRDGGTADAAKDTGSTRPDTGTDEPDAWVPHDDAGDAGTAAKAAATIAALRPEGGATGSATFVEANGMVAVTLTVDGPPGVHGVHVHQNGSCDSTTDDAGVVTAGGAAGGHFNPTDAGHGFPDGAAHHPGDFGNITIDDAGHGTLSLTAHSITVASGATSVIGHALVVHANPDDGVTQPTGNSGGRIGCGVIAPSN